MLVILSIFSLTINYISVYIAVTNIISRH